MTYRYYLQDARFAVIQELDNVMADTIASALQSPVFDVSLGRKNCVPTDFIYRGTFGSFEEASTMAESLMGEKDLEVSFTVKDEEVEGDRIVLHDVPLQFGQFKKYRDRTVTIIQND